MIDCDAPKSVSDRTMTTLMLRQGGQTFGLSVATIRVTGVSM